MIRYLILISVFINSYAKSNFTFECPFNQEIQVANLRYSPCISLNKQLNKLNFTNKIENLILKKKSKCNEEYLFKNSNQIFNCRENTPASQAKERTFRDSFPICLNEAQNGTESLEDFVYRQSVLGPMRRQHDYRIPTFEEKILWREFGHSIRERNWENSLEIALKLKAKLCRFDDEILLLLAADHVNKRKWNGIILMIRTSDNALPLALSGAHGNDDLDTGKQAINVFSRSKSVFLAVVSPYSRESSGEFDPCKPGSKVTDNSHSMENSFFHALAGFAEAFEQLSFIEFHRCANCGAIRIGRAVQGRSSKPDSLIRVFIQAAEEHIIPKLSNSAKNRGFYAAIYPAALSTSRWFEPTTPGSSFFSRTNTIGRLLQGLNRLCGGNRLYALAKDDTSRFLHVEQQGGFSIKEYNGWAEALDSLRNTPFMVNRSIEVYKYKYK
jgi:hypothetical protein